MFTLPLKSIQNPSTLYQLHQITESKPPSSLTYVIAIATCQLYPQPFTSNPTQQPEGTFQNIRKIMLLICSKPPKGAISFSLTTPLTTALSSLPAPGPWLWPPCCSSMCQGSSLLNASYFTISSAWEVLPPNIHRMHFLTSLKPLLKCHLFRQTFPDLCQIASSIALYFPHFCLFYSVYHNLTYSFIY